MNNLDNYQLFVFDCDGVILNSNAVKTQGFYTAAAPYGLEAARALADHHMRHGGISRFVKFEYFFKEILHRSFTGDEYRQILEAFAQAVQDGLMRCEVATGLSELRRRVGGSRWLVASGGDEAELRHIFAARDLAQFFDAGIFGSPRSKIEILNEAAKGVEPSRVLFLGDSRHDHEVAERFGFDFAFVRGWTEFMEHESYFSTRSAFQLQSLSDLVQAQVDHA